jgi:hypothetical protein
VRLGLSRRRVTRAQASKEFREAHFSIMKRRGNFGRLTRLAPGLFRPRIANCQPRAGLNGPQAWSTVRRDDYRACKKSLRLKGF